MIKKQLLNSGRIRKIEGSFAFDRYFFQVLSLPDNSAVRQDNEPMHPAVQNLYKKWVAIKQP